MCEAEGLTTAGEELDHIVPLMWGGSNDDSNLQLLCVTCHKIKTSKELGYDVSVKGFDANGEPIDPANRWYR